MNFLVNREFLTSNCLVQRRKIITIGIIAQALIVLVL